MNKATVRMLHALLGMMLVLALPGCAPAGYSDTQFEEALRAYLEVAREDDTDAARKLLELGEQTDNPEILRDATFAAISTRDIELARRAGEAWYAAGGEGALLVLTRILVSTEGLDRSSGMLGRLAEEEGPEVVYQAMHLAEPPTARALAFRAAHPTHLRDDQYFAYLTLLHLDAKNLAEARQALREGVSAQPDSVPLLLVALYLAELANEDSVSIELVSRLADATDTDVATAVIVYSQWAAVAPGQRQLLPDQEQFAAGEEDQRFPDLALLFAGRFYLRHQEPRTAVEILQQIEASSPSRAEAVRMLVVAYQELGEGYIDTTLGLLGREIAGAPAELVPEFAEMYAETVNARDGPQPAYEFLDQLKRGRDNPNLLFLKSVYAERTGMIDNAEQALRRLIEIDPDSSIGYNALGYMFADHNIRLAEAELLIVKALEIEPDSAAIIDSLGWVLYRRGDLAGALSYLEDSVRRMGNRPHPEVLAHLAEVLWELGQFQRSKEILAIAQAIDPHDRAVLKVLEKYQLEGVDS